MALFNYRATTMNGDIVKGVMEASDEKEAVERIKNTGIIPIRISAPKISIRKHVFLRSAKSDLLTFTTELSALLGAGLPLDRSLNILSGISEQKELKEIIQAVLKSIREGNSFSDALAKHSRTFPRLYVNMIRAGEAGGVLDAVLDKLNEFLESSKELKDHVFSSMIYPTILLITGSISIAFLVTFVLPKFSVIFSEIGKTLPLQTQILLSMSNSLKSYWWVVLLALISGWFLFRNYVKTDGGRYQWDTFKLKMMGDVIRKLETARFCRTLGTLLRSGVPLLQALHNSKDVISNKVIASTVDAVSKGAKEGKGIALPLSEAKVFPPLALSMIKVGEETGQLDTMLLKVATAYEKGMRVSIRRFMSLLEPAMILGMGLIIGFIVVSMLMAIFSITEIPF